MRRPRKSEKLLLRTIAALARPLLQQQRGLELGQLIAIIRRQLTMSQRALARRAGIGKTTISRIESGSLQPNISTLEKILDALECDLLITAVPRKDLDAVRKNQALTKAKKKIQYLRGTMSLEKQEPDPELLSELIEDEAAKLLESPGLWDEE